MKTIKLDKIKILELNLKNIKDILNIQKEQHINILSKKNILKDLNNSNFKYFIAKYENKILGYISFSYVVDIEIESIVIKKDFQRLGIGTLLLNIVFNFAQKNNINSIFLEVRKSNIPAKNLYIKNGFKVINIRKKYYTDNNEDALILKKDITT